MSKSAPSREGSAVIEDGYTRDAYLAGVPFTTPAVRFSYRPPMVRDLAIIRRGISQAMASQMPTIQAQAMVKYLVKWDLNVDLKMDALLKLAPEIFDGVSGILLGLRPTDIDPDWNSTESTQATELESVFGGDILKSEESDSKN